MVCVCVEGGVEGRVCVKAVTRVTASVTTYFFVPDMEASWEIILSLGLFTAKGAVDPLIVDCWAAQGGRGLLPRPGSFGGGWRDN